MSDETIDIHQIITKKRQLDIVFRLPDGYGLGNTGQCLLPVGAALQDLPCFNAQALHMRKENLLPSTRILSAPNTSANPSRSMFMLSFGALKRPACCQTLYEAAVCLIMDRWRKTGAHQGQTRAAVQTRDKKSNWSFSLGLTLDLCCFLQSSHTPDRFGAQRNQGPHRE